MGVDPLQLWGNACRIERADLGPGSRLRATLTGASFTREIAGFQERVDPFRCRQFFDVVHQAWILELRGNIRSGGFVPWLIDAITELGGTERGLTERILSADLPEAPLFLIQFEGVEGTVTLEACSLRRLAVDFRGRRKQSWAAQFVSRYLNRGAATWQPAPGITETIEGGEILVTNGPGARVSLAADMAGDPLAKVQTAYEGTLEIGMPELAAAGFDADGIPRTFERGNNWDITGRLLLPEIAGITDAALYQTWSGEINIATSDEPGKVLEIEAGIIGQIERRTAIAYDFRQVQFDFVGRRGAGKPCARFLSDMVGL